MPTLSMGEMESLALEAGLSGADVPIAGAVGMAESHGNPTVHNPILPDVVGVWQINTRAHPEFSVQAMTDPAQNAAAMVKIKRASGWQAWSTYTSGAYRAYMPAANRAIPAGGPHAATKAGAAGRAAGQTITDTASSLSSVNDFAAKLSDPAVWRRTAYVLVGVVLVLMGIILMTGETKTVRMAAKTVAGMVPETKIAKAVAA